MSSRISDDGPIKYLPLTKEHEDEVLNLMRYYFYREETLSKAIDLHKHFEAIFELDCLVVDAIKDGLSLIAVEEETGIVVSCLINKINVKSSTSNSYFESFKLDHPKTKVFMELNSKIDRIVPCYEILKTDCYCECLFVVTLPEFRNRGIARAMVSLFLESMQLLQNGKDIQQPNDKKCVPFRPLPTGITAICTSAPSKRIFESLGFSCATEIILGDTILLPVSVMYKFLK